MRFSTLLDILPYLSPLKSEKNKYYIGGFVTKGGGEGKRRRRARKKRRMQRKEARMRASETNTARRDNCSFVQMAVRHMKRKRIVCCLSKALFGKETRALSPVPPPPPRCERATM